MTVSRTRAARSGTRRPCSQSCTARTSSPNRSANFWRLSFMRLRSATMWAAAGSSRSNGVDPAHDVAFVGDDCALRHGRRDRRGEVPYRQDPPIPLFGVPQTRVLPRKPFRTTQKTIRITQKTIRITHKTTRDRILDHLRAEPQLTRHESCPQTHPGPPSSSPSAHSHPLDELLTRPAFDQRVGDPVDALRAGQLLELFPQPPSRCQRAESRACRPAARLAAHPEAHGRGPGLAEGQAAGPVRPAFAEVVDVAVGDAGEPFERRSP